MERMIEVVCGVISDSAGRTLVCKRGQDRPLGGLWEFPGGKVDADETREIALKRELLEELAIEVEVGQRFSKIVEWTDGEISIRLTGFHCMTFRGEPRAIEHEEIRWCAISEFSDLDWAEADIPLVEELIRSQKNRAIEIPRIDETM